MNPMYPNYSTLAPLTRVSTRGEESILSNLYNNKWIRISNQVLECLTQPAIAQIKERLVAIGSSEEDAAGLIESLVQHGFIDDGRSNVHPNELSLLPSSAYINVTDHCNIACTHCYYGSHPGLTHGLSNDQLCKVVDSLHSGGIRKIVIAGGEPMSRPGIEELLTYVGSKQFADVTLLTNGTIMTEAQACLIAGCVDVVHVSLDGPNEELNAVIRGHGNFDSAVEGVRKLKAAGVKKILLVTNINSANIGRLHEMRVLRDELGVALGNNIFAAVGRASKHKHLMPTHRSLVEFFLGETTQLACDLSVSGFSYLDIHSGVTCGSGTLMVSVDCHGDVFPCHLFHKPELRIGNLLSQPDLVQMLKDSAVAIQMRARTVETRKCHGCDVEYFCKGGCLAHTVAAHDDSSNPWKERDPFCEVHHAVISAQLWPSSR